MIFISKYINANIAWEIFSTKWGPLIKDGQVYRKFEMNVALAQLALDHGLLSEVEGLKLHYHIRAIIRDLPGYSWARRD